MRAAQNILCIFFIKALARVGIECHLMKIVISLERYDSIEAILFIGTSFHDKIAPEANLNKLCARDDVDAFCLFDIIPALHSIVACGATAS